MHILIRSTLLAFALLALAACGKGKQEEAPVAAPVELKVPTDNDDLKWREYLTGVVKQNMQGIRSSPFMYYLPSEEAEDFEDQYERQLENVVGTVSRGVLPGNMLAFGSPASTRMADLIEEAFQNAVAGSMKDVRVLYIGSQEDAERIRPSVEASGAGFVHVDIK
jgi:predicted small lipoprotein YifL